MLSASPELGSVPPLSSHWVKPVFLLLFFGSGCSALIYEVIWFQQLQLVIGSSGVSLAVLLGTFMGGMSLGSMLTPRLIPGWHPLRVYALLELGIGGYGIAVLLGLPHVEAFYASHANSDATGLVLRGAVSAACLILPSMLMGATLPAAAKWFAAEPPGTCWVGLCYGANIFGAVFGSLVTGFYLLRVYDLATATYLAVAINGVAGIAAMACSFFGRRCVAFVPRTIGQPSGSGIVCLAIAISGFTALSSEVIWTRLLALLFGGSIYSFSIILAAFLTGLGIGSLLGSFVSSCDRARTAFGFCQVLLAAAIAWSAYELAESLPYWPVLPTLARNPWHQFRLDLVRGLWVVMPAALLWGASFPLAVSAATRPGTDPGPLTARIYSANTLGAILGALCSSLFLISSLGSQRTQQLLIGITAVSGVLLLATRATTSRWRRIGESVAALGVAALLLLSVPPVSSELMAWGRAVPTIPGPTKILFQGEGIHTSVVVAEPLPGIRSFHVAGKIEASSAPQDMRLQLMLGHLPALLHPKPRSVLIVGCGAGVTAGCFAVHPGVERIVICEIEPLVPQAARNFFAVENHRVLEDPRTQLVLDDARHFLAHTSEQFDIITTDPMHPWVKGAAALYTEEYLELCRRRLKPGGFVTQWVPLYESDEPTVRSEIATFATVFPDASVWANTLRNTGYDTVLLGGNGSPRIAVSELNKKLEGVEFIEGRAALRDVSIGSGWDLLGTYAGRATDLGPWLKGAALNRDRNLRLQYLAGMSANTYQSGPILEAILKYRLYPSDLFITTDEEERRLRQLIRPPER